jgi:hypothetical protein
MNCEGSVNSFKFLYEFTLQLESLKTLKGDSLQRKLNQKVELFLILPLKHSVAGGLKL